MKTQTEILQRIKELVKTNWNWSEEEMFSEKAKRIREYNNARISNLSWILGLGDRYDICPYCGEIMECDMVDIGIGYQQCGPHYCENCHASEIHSSDTLELNPFEKETGYYQDRHSPLANTCCGVLVDHDTARQLYERGCLDNCCPSDLTK